MKVRLLLFAVLKDITGKSEAELSLAEGTRAADVWQAMRSEYGSLLRFDQPPMIAINEEYARPETPLRDGDELAFIPPVAGG